MPSRERVNAFVATVRAGRYVEAIEQFYAPEATMRDNGGPPRGGRDVLIAHEKAMLGQVRDMATRQASPVIVDGDRVVLGWVFEFTTADGEIRRLDELALQTWRDEHIVEERFYYDPAQLAVAAVA
ncbi:MAG TPA: nuclear transport factor 2 family protein [Caulobacteraceae bacterium]|nr:nuclear transport factor 2 family protein [Caulobacteraceae bacterium]